MKFPKTSIPVVMICVLMLGCSDIKHVKYQDFQAASADRAQERGWLPIYVPQTARDIREQCDLDSNRVWGKFNFVQNETAPIEKHCRKSAAQVVTITAPNPSWWPAFLSGNDWWPDFLHGDVKRSDLLARGFELYDCQHSSNTFLVVNRSSKVAFFWAR